MKKYKVNKEKCIGCSSCVAMCPQGFKIDINGKSQVIDSEAVEKCGGINTCPFGAVEEISDSKE